MFVKICGITSREDAQAAAAMGASALGFNFYPQSPRYLRPEQVAQIADGIDILRVGVFVNESPAYVMEAAIAAKLDVIQLHGDEGPDFLLDGVRIWKAFRVTESWTPAVLDSFRAEAFLLDGPRPGQGKSFDWTVARGLSQPIILAGGLGPDNVAEAIRTVRPWGVDACSSLEKAPGQKNQKSMRCFIEAALSESSS